MACAVDNEADRTGWTPVEIKRDYDLAWVQAVNQWVEGDEARGVMGGPPHSRPPFTLWFSDPNTAFAFKMRFG